MNFMRKLLSANCHIELVAQSIRMGWRRVLRVKRTHKFRISFCARRHWHESLYDGLKLWLIALSIYDSSFFISGFCFFRSNTHIATCKEWWKSFQLTSYRIHIQIERFVAEASDRRKSHNKVFNAMKTSKKILLWNVFDWCSYLSCHCTKASPWNNRENFEFEWTTNSVSSDNNRKIICDVWTSTNDIRTAYT